MTWKIELISLKTDTNTQTFNFTQSAVTVTLAVYSPTVFISFFTFFLVQREKWIMFGSWTSTFKDPCLSLFVPFHPQPIQSLKSLPVTASVCLTSASEFAVKQSTSAREGSLFILIISFISDLMLHLCSASCWWAVDFKVGFKILKPSGLQNNLLTLIY